MWKEFTSNNNSARTTFKSVFQRREVGALKHPNVTEHELQKDLLKLSWSERKKKPPEHLIWSN